MRDATPRIHGAGAELVVVGSGTVEQAAWFAEDLHLTTPVYTNPSRELFRALASRRSLWRVLHPGTLLAALRAWRGGFRQESVQGDPLELGGVFVVGRGGEFRFAHRSRWAGDHPKATTVIRALGEDHPLPLHPIDR